MTFAADVLNAAWASFYLNHPVFQVTQNTTQTYTSGSPAIVNWTNLQFDNYAGGSLVNNNYTIQVPGWYRCSVIYHFNGNASGVRFANATKNGTAQIFFCNRTGMTSLSSTGMDGLIQCAAGDVIQIEALQDSGGSLASFVSSNYVPSWTMEWIRS